jgi:hypothetical protein
MMWIDSSFTNFKRASLPAKKVYVSFSFYIHCPTSGLCSSLESGYRLTFELLECLNTPLLLQSVKIFAVTKATDAHGQWQKVSSQPFVHFSRRSATLLLTFSYLLLLLVTTLSILEWFNTTVAMVHQKTHRGRVPVDAF